MISKTTLKQCISGSFLLAVPVAALMLFAPTITQSHADGMAGLDSVPTVNIDTANELEVVTLSNWSYTGVGRCPPALRRKGPGHPAFDKHCSPL